ncbi:MAG: regulatory protein RecX [Candidatus Tectomicrobia bacterium]|uniref:Regulatory protein RecX n=1 Tax=Tectimicrobiota bacterium TaxID=2528274 RepID=A0A933LQA2_UNCTE|nr:regulatory protein RecX [Candidatus Tectomicrobia bacterium]
MMREENHHRCHQASLNLLKYRPRSELELKQRLLRKGFLPDVIEKTLIHLKDISLIDDRAFASMWTDSRKANRSKRLIRLELQQKGISRDVAQQVTSDVDEESTALALAKKKARSLKGKTPGEFQGKILTYLLQKGFNYDISKRAVRTILSEAMSQTDQQDKR